MLGKGSFIDLNNQKHGMVDVVSKAQNICAGISILEYPVDCDLFVIKFEVVGMTNKVYVHLCRTRSAIYKLRIRVGAKLCARPREILSLTRCVSV